MRRILVVGLCWISYSLEKVEEERGTREARYIIADIV